MTVKEQIKAKCDELAEMLIAKNEKYGNSALAPCRVFSKSDDLEQIRVRMDDKLSRIKNNNGTDDEDPYLDLAGYLVLYLIAKDNGKQNEEVPTQG